MPAAGKYRHRITITAANPETPRNGFGERTAAGATVAQVWADKLDLSGSENVEAKTEYADVSTRFDIRYRTGIEAKMSISEQPSGTQYDIVAVLDAHGLHKELQLLCKRKENQ